MTDTLAVVDAGEFDRLFIQHLGWNSPTQSPLTVTDPFGNTFTVTQVASFRGMGIWTCPAIPDLTAQRHIDAAVAAKTLERLIIYTDGTHQEWRWPRSSSRKRSGPPTLVPHRHTVGQPNPALVERLGLIEIPMGSDITVPELLDKMREAFDREAETASKQAARLMGGLYEKLEVAGMGEQESSIFLARLLFLMFGDDTNMWQRNLFHDFIAEDTDADGSNLRERLLEAFAAADTDIKDRPKDLSPGLRDLPYINGGIFSDPLRMPDLDGDFRKALLETCRFDWGQISPAVFGSMFQTVKTKEARRHLGEHYTTEENILKTIEPLFLDELRERLDAAWDDRKALTKLHNELGELRFLDPACGCGNFLIVAYRELRALELALMIRQRDLALAAGDKKAMQLAVDATHGLKISIEQFYGIEIEAWPARIAETAMFLIDHQANLRMDHELGTAPTRLPLEVSPHIHLGNALRMDWGSIFPFKDHAFIVGNPPFLGMSMLSPEQQEDRSIVARMVSGAYRLGRLDYVASWFIKAVLLGSKARINFAFVSTNSLVQGENARSLGQLLEDHGFRINFAHRTMPWLSEASGAAAVHVVITGATNTPCKPPFRIYDVGQDAAEGPSLARNINIYLVDSTLAYVGKHSSPFIRIPKCTEGNKPQDGGGLIVESEDYDAILADEPDLAEYVRPLIGAQNSISGTARYCFWLKDAPTRVWKESKLLAPRLEMVREARLRSRTPSARDKANTPQLFLAIRQPTSEWLCIPSVSSERRRVVPMAYYPATAIAHNSIMAIDAAPKWLFALLQSAAWMTWVRAVGGRLKSDLRVTPDMSYNAFPWPDVDVTVTARLTEFAGQILSYRSQQTGKSLAELYAPEGMESGLVALHDALDRYVDSLYGLASPSDSERLERLFDVYLRWSREGQLPASKS